MSSKKDSFKFYLKIKFSRKKNNSKSNALSDETLDLLEEIERENRPDQ